MAALRKMPRLTSVELPLLMDDLLLYIPSIPKPSSDDDDDDRSSQPSRPHSPISDRAYDSDNEEEDSSAPTAASDAHQPHVDLITRPRIEFHANLDDISTRTVKSLLLSSTPTSTPYPLPHLKSLTFSLHPTPQLSRDLRGLRIFAPAMVWRKNVQWNDEDGDAAPTLVKVPREGKGRRVPGERRRCDA